MGGRTRFLSVEDVLLIQSDTLEHEGGLAGVRDFGLLESAVMMPRQQFGGVHLHRTLAEQAAAYLFHLCRNHPFNDGNKRAAVLAALAPWLASPRHPKTLQNAKYDRLVLLRHGLALEGVVMDTMLADYLRDSGDGHGLEAMAQRNFGFSPTSYEIGRAHV